ncbi:MAG: hypothetical protein ACOZNI_30505 [Myxococcota bacterium]
MDLSTIKVDTEVANRLRTDAQNAGVPVQEYISQILRRWAAEAGASRPTYVPIARMPDAIAGFKGAQDKNRHFVVVFYDLVYRNRPVILAGELKQASDVHIALYPPGGFTFPIPLDSIVAWHEYTSDYERNGYMHLWKGAGAEMHGLVPSGWRI